MRIGIIGEFNPFHNGHKYFIDKIKDKYPDSFIVLVMSGNFTQRGIPSIYDKWDKSKIAINNGSEIHFIGLNGWLLKKYSSLSEINTIILGDSIAGIVYKDKVEIVQF